MNRPRILVTGATGNIGRPLVAQLHAAGADVIAGSPSGKPVGPVPGRAVDFNNPAQLEQAFAGIDRAFLLFPLVENKRELARHALAAARAAGVKHLVRSSGAGADPASPYAITRLQGEIDAMVGASGIPATVLLPSTFMQNFATYYAGMIKQGTVYLPHEQASTSFIDTQDIARVACTILLEPAGHAGATYPLSGPESLTTEQALQQIADAGGMRASYVAVPDAAAVESMRNMGMDSWTVDIMSSLNAIVRAGATAGITDAVARITGAAPRTFGQFARDNVDAWR